MSDELGAIKRMTDDELFGILRTVGPDTSMAEHVRLEVLRRIDERQANAPVVDHNCRGFFRVGAGPQWIATGDTFIHLVQVQRNRAYFCTCSQPSSVVCEGCGRPLADVLEGGDLILSGVRCDQCGWIYPFVEAPRACDAE